MGRVNERILSTVNREDAGSTLGYSSRLLLRYLTFGIEVEAGVPSIRSILRFFQQLFICVTSKDEFTPWLVHFSLHLSNLFLVAFLSLCEQLLKLLHCCVRPFLFLSPLVFQYIMLLKGVLNYQICIGLEFGYRFFGEAV